MDSPTIAVLVPCFNEEAAVDAVVSDLRAALPEATVYVYDNASTDHTAQVAAHAGAVVRTEPRKGKGNVVRRAFADLDADVLLMIDGDDTYDATAAGELVEALLAGPHDQVVAVRRGEHESVHRRGHATGNAAFAWLVSSLFDTPTEDLFSGYRAFSRRFVRSFPGLSAGFEIETELTVHAARLRLPTVEIPLRFSERPEGGESKLRTVSDGLRILSTVGRLLWLERPVAVHGVLAALLTFVALGLGLPVVADYFATGLVAQLPRAVLALGLVVLAALSVGIGLLLAATKRAREEQARLWYLAQPPPPVMQPGWRAAAAAAAPTVREGGDVRDGGVDASTGGGSRPVGDDVVEPRTPLVAVHEPSGEGPGPSGRRATGQPPGGTARAAERS